MVADRVTAVLQYHRMFTEHLLNVSLLTEIASGGGGNTILFTFLYSSLDVLPEVRAEAF